MQNWSRRSVIASTLAAPFAPALLGPDAARAQGGAAPAPISFFAWSPVESLIRPEIIGFERATRRRVNTASLPWAAYREALVTRMVSGARIDVVAMSDLWLPEFVDRGWLAALDDLPGMDELTAETRPLCNDGMRWKGRCYGLPYYADSVTFLYNRDLLDRAGIERPPQTWDEVVEQGQHLQRRGLVRHALGIPLADDPWLIEIVSALVFSHGGRCVDDDGRAVMADAERGCIPAIRFLRNAMTQAAILSPESPRIAEMDVLEAMSEGEHAFCLLPSYRLPILNDASGSAVAGKIRAALIPRGGPQGQHMTCGWVRFFAPTTGAMADPARRAGVEAFLPAIGGRGQDGHYGNQRRWLIEGGLPFCAQPLLQDREVEAMLDRTTGSTAILRRQGTLTRPKDLIYPWIGRWMSQSTLDASDALNGRATPEVAIGRMAERWMTLRAEHG